MGRAERLRVVLIALLFAPGCKCAQAMRCQEAQGDRAACRARAEDCYTIERSRCAGDCPTLCVADEAAQRCTIPEQRACPADLRIFAGGRVGDLAVYDWKRARLSEPARALGGVQLTRAQFDGLTAKDREELCGAYPGDACGMFWDEAHGRADCRIPPDACDRCRLEASPIDCVPINKCNDVICL